MLLYFHGWDTRFPICKIRVHRYENEKSVFSKTMRTRIIHFDYIGRLLPVIPVSYRLTFLSNARRITAI